MSNLPFLSSKKAQAQTEKQTDYIRQNTPIYVKEIIKKYNINNRILTEIVIEGYKKKWPLPEFEDDLPFYDKINP